jgi:outer membrane protein TolC
MIECALARRAIALVLAAALIAPLAAQSSPKALSVEEAVASGLATDPGILAATLDARAAKFREADARFKMLPSLAVSTGYTRLSAEPLPSLSGISLPQSLEDEIYQYIKANDIDMNSLLQLFASPTTERDVRVDLQYPIFAGFRLQEAAKIAKYQALGKQAATELTHEALAFEIRRAYWESVRAQSNVEAVQKALDLEAFLRDETAKLVDQGMANEADSLAEEARYDQTKLALDETLSGQELAFLMLSSLVGDKNASQGGDVAYTLTSVPGSKPPVDALKAAEQSDDGALVGRALANRPETRVATITLNALDAARVAARSDLYPTLSLTGSLSYADPDPRIFPTEDIFNLSWSVGLRLRYDIGGVPGAVERGQAADADLEKARADLAKQRNAIALDVRKCALALKRARNSLELTKGMVAQAEEGARVADQKYGVGMAKHSEVLQAQLALVRAQLAVKGKLIDVEIAQADLERAIGLE